MHIQSRIAFATASKSTELVPFNSHFNPYMTAAILETSFLTMSLKCHHLHAISEIHDIYSLDFHLASGIWCVLKDLSRSIHEAADPTVDPFKLLPHYINPNRLNKIGMAAPQVLMIKKYSQNMLLSATSFDNILKLFKMVQTVGLEAVRWIEEAKEGCEILGGQHGWIWPYSGAIKPNLPLLEGQGSIMVGADVDLDSNIPSTRPSSPDYSKALILHPVHSNFARAHPEYNPFTSLDTILDYPTYGDNDLSVSNLLDHLSIGMESASME